MKKIKTKSYKQAQYATSLRTPQPAKNATATDPQRIEQVDKALGLLQTNLIGLTNSHRQMGLNELSTLVATFRQTWEKKKEQIINELV